MPGSTGPEGYADWQKVANWDGPILVSESKLANTKQVEFGRFNVSRYAGLLFNCLSGGAIPRHLRVKLTWFTAQTGGQIVGQQNIVIAKPSEGPENTYRYILTNRGPWLLIEVEGIGAGEWEAALVISATNRQPTGMIALPLIPELIPQTELAVEKVHTEPVRPKFAHAGSAILSVLAAKTAASAIFVVQALSITGAWADITTISPKANNTWEPVAVTLPLGAWRIVMFNQAAEAQTLGVAMAASPTG